MTELFRPQRARDTTEEELIALLEKNLMLMVFIKYDGVRCNVIDNVVMGKSMLPITNQYIQNLYGRPEFEGMEFEIIVTQDGQYNPVTCCSETVSFTNSKYMEREHKCVLFDDNSIGRMKYIQRFSEMEWFVTQHPTFMLPEYINAFTTQAIWDFEDKVLAQDHEAIIIRNPYLRYAQGVSSKEGELLRLKRYISEEAVILDVQPAYKNGNEAKTNALGYTERSSKSAGKIAKEEIGSLLCKTVKDIYDPWSRRLLFPVGTLCVVTPGNMTKDEKIALFKEKEDLKGKMIAFKSFPKGTKDKPRFPMFQHFVPVFDQP